MNADIFKGIWGQVQGQVKQWWGKLTDDDITYIGGSWDKLVGKLQERYGYSKEEAETEAESHLSHKHGISGD